MATEDKNQTTQPTPQQQQPKGGMRDDDEYDVDDGADAGLPQMGRAAGAPAPILETAVSDTPNSPPAPAALRRGQLKAAAVVAPVAAAPVAKAPAARGGYGQMKGTAIVAAPDNDLSKGVAFDINKAVDVSNAQCAGTTGHCLEHVANALKAGGLDVRKELPTRPDGSHWAKDMSPLLQRDSNFCQVASGNGATFDDKNFQAKKGDIVVWEGGQYGHIQMCVGSRPDGSPIWQSDFTAREGNWSGLKDPASHGHFRVFRQNTTTDDVRYAKQNAAPAAGRAPAQHLMA